MLAPPFTKVFSSFLESPTTVLLLLLDASLLIFALSLAGLTALRMNFFCGGRVFSDELFLGELVPLTLFLSDEGTSLESPVGRLKSEFS